MHTDLDPARDTPDLAFAEPAGQLSDRVLQQLRAAVLDGDFGVRERLTEAGLARRLGVSRTPVRQALARLDVDGLIRRTDGCYFVVIPDLSELSDLYELRVTLELRGIARAIEDPAIRHDRDLLLHQQSWWTELSQALPAPDPGFVRLDERFHVALLTASGNPALTAALVSVNERIRRVRMYDFLTQDRIADTVREHLEIVRLLVAGDLGPAYRALHDHVGASLDVVRDRAQRALTQMTLNGGLS